jgi:excinuclease UvrABC ATPase subunit
MAQEYIEIRGARENNLKDVSLRLPKRKITIFTGVSGSGKSSVVFDTIANEAQRLLFENFSMFIRNLLPRYPQPDADAIENLSMAVIVDQKRLGGGSQSRLCCACSFRGSVNRTWAMRMRFPSTTLKACVWSVMVLAARSELTRRRSLTKPSP